MQLGSNALEQRYIFNYGNTQVQMKNILRTLVVIATLGTTCIANSQVYVEGGGADCGQWIKARNAERAGNFEHFVLGFLNGMALTTDKEFWAPRGGPKVSREAVYLWMDNYCRTNPLNAIATGVVTLFRERADWRP